MIAKIHQELFEFKSGKRLEEKDRVGMKPAYLLK
jgi:hypothetical protein